MCSSTAELQLVLTWHLQALPVSKTISQIVYSKSPLKVKMVKGQETGAFVNFRDKGLDSKLA